MFTSKLFSLILENHYLSVGAVGRQITNKLNSDPLNIIVGHDLDSLIRSRLNSSCRHHLVHTVVGVAHCLPEQGIRVSHEPELVALRDAEISVEKLGEAVEEARMKMKFWLVRITEPGGVEFLSLTIPSRISFSPELRSSMSWTSPS